MPKLSPILSVLAGLTLAACGPNTADQSQTGTQVEVQGRSSDSAVEATTSLCDPEGDFTKYLECSTAELEEISAGLDAEVENPLANSSTIVTPERIAADQKFCTAGVARACRSLGVAYEKGQGVTNDDTKAFEFNNKACDAGHAEACSSIANFYEKGIGVAKDAIKAAEYIRKACDRGRSINCYNIAVGYLNDSEFSEAANYFEKACIIGDIDACYWAGTLFANFEEKGVTLDFDKSYKYYKKSCEGKNASGCNGLGTLYYRGTAVAKDLSLALKFSKMACEIDSTLCDNYEFLKSE